MKYFLVFIKKFISASPIPVEVDHIGRVLVVDLNFIGDMLFTSPVYKALKNNFQNSNVEALVYPFVSGIVSANPFVDNVSTIPKVNLLKQLSTLLKLRNKKFDLVLQLNTSLRTNFLMWIIGGKYRLGYDYANRGCFNNIRVPIATRTARTRYRVDECIELLEQAFGWKISDREMVLPVAMEHKQKVFELLDKFGVIDTDILIGIQANCRGTWKERKWEQSKFSDLANKLIEKYKSKIVFTGSKDDTEYLCTIIQGIKFSDNVINFAGKTNLMELAALLQRVNVFISVNTGPMQIAVSQKTPTAVLMGVTPPVITYPMNVPIFQYVWTGSHDLKSQLSVDPKDPMRMKAITVEQVMEKVDYLLGLKTKKT